MDMMEIFGRCLHCIIPNRFCWKSQEFVSRGILFGDEQRVPLSFCLVRSTVHEAEIKMKEKMDRERASLGTTIIVKKFNIDSLDMTKKYWVS
jgi:hypothetical protein